MGERSAPGASGWLWRCGGCRSARCRLAYGADWVCATVWGQRREPLYEETPVDCGSPLGGVAGRGAVSATAAGCRRPDKQLDTPQYRRYLHRRNDRDVLQRTHRPEHGWLRIARRYGIEQRYRIEQRVWIERWCGWCWPHRIVNSALLGVSATQRIVQLTKTKLTAGRHCPSLIECDLPSTAATPTPAAWRCSPLCVGHFA